MIKAVIMLHGGPLRDFHRSKYRSFSQEQVKYLAVLNEQGFQPQVIYDIGAGVLHWVREAKRFWPEATYVLFEAGNDLCFLYNEYNHHIGMLGNTHLLNDPKCHGDSRGLDTVVFLRGFPLPDFVKVDAREGGLAVFMGGITVFSNARYIIMELQDCVIPELCSTMMLHGWELHHSITYTKPQHIDYVFKNVRI